MNRVDLLAVALAVALVAESSVLALPLISAGGPRARLVAVGSPESYTFGYATFNHPVTNNTDQEFNVKYNGSWSISITNSLRAAAKSNAEAELAFAPSYPVEGKSIPTIIVQERSDGLLRIEYFAQSWPHTYGLVLYNSTSPGWLGAGNVTLRFVSLGKPSEINPQIAPRSNGNLTILIGNSSVFSDYPIAWASLAEVYLYGLDGSSFVSGSVGFTVQPLG